MTGGGRSMRVGLVCPYSFDTPGGVQNHVLGLADHLRAEGHEAQVLAPGDYLPEGGSAPPEWFTSAGASWAVPYNGSIARVNFGVLSAGRVRRWLRAGDFDLLHIHEPVTPSISMLALWATDVPVVATFHTATPRSRTMQVAGTALRAAIEKIDAGIAVSESARKVVVQHLGRDAVVIPNGFSFDDFAGTATPPALGVAAHGPGDAMRQAAPGRGPRIFFLGRMDEPRKGLDTLLAALPLLRTSFPDLELVVAGTGHRALPAGCRSVGVVTARQKAELLAGSDVFVAPHLARESFGIVLLEAMASQTPVVASDLPAFVDLLAPGPGAEPLWGSTFPVGDSVALARTIQRVLDHPHPARLAAGRERSRRYDWSVVGPEVSEVYRAAREVAGPGVGSTAVAS